ncbi:MAG: hypothetical protein KJO97_08410, partial [Acidimicrobiia bacterium]|nr:hypothetical protein [Acidimicrobiia bacterium]
LLTDGDSEPEAVPTTTSTLTSSSTTTVEATTTTVADTTTTSLDPDERLAEVARILEDLEIAWYDAVYRKDESVLPDIVATQLFYDAAVDAMEVADFAAPPSDETIDLIVYEILLDRADCLVVYHQLDLGGILVGSEPSDGVQTMWPTESGGYRLVRLWSGPGDLWIEDCDSLNRDEVP